MNHEHNDTHEIRPIYLYTTGYVLSLVLTALSFGIVAAYRDTLSEAVLLGTLSALAILQLLTQLIFFLHMSAERKPRWNLTAGVLAVLFAVLLVGGSLWIMANLEHNLVHDMFEEENISPSIFTE